MKTIKMSCLPLIKNPQFSNVVIMLRAVTRYSISNVQVLLAISESGRGDDGGGDSKSGDNDSGDDSGDDDNSNYNVSGSRYMG